MPLLPISKIRFCELSIIAGSIMSISFGPWLGGACGSAVASVCHARNRTRAMLVLIIAAIVIGGPIYSAFKAFVSVDRSFRGIRQSAARGLGVPKSAFTTLYSGGRRASDLGLGT